MVNNEQQSPDLATAGSNDAEAVAAHDAAAAAAQKKKRTKLILYIALFIIFQTAVFTIFDLTIMQVRTPKFRLSNATLANLNAGTPANPSLRATMSAEFSVKNVNFGRYKYGSTTVEFFYRGGKIGEVLVPESRAKWRSTRKFRADVDLNFVNAQRNSLLSSDLSGGVVPITSSAKMVGSVELIFVLRKDRSADMNCSMEIATDQITNIICD